MLYLAQVEVSVNGKFRHYAVKHVTAENEQKARTKVENHIRTIKKDNRECKIKYLNIAKG